LPSQDFSHEYQAVIAYVLYSQILKGAEFMYVAGELDKYAVKELNHCLILGEQIDYLASMLVHETRALSTSKKVIEMLQLEHDNEAEPFGTFFERISQREELADYAIAKRIGGILIDKQTHHTALKIALSKNASSQLQAA
jgi:bacterioferritin